MIDTVNNSVNNSLYHSFVDSNSDQKSFKPIDAEIDTHIYNYALKQLRTTQMIGDFKYGYNKNNQTIEIKELTLTPKKTVKSMKEFEIRSLSFNEHNLTGLMDTAAKVEHVAWCLIKTMQKTGFAEKVFIGNKQTKEGDMLNIKLEQMLGSGYKYEVSKYDNSTNSFQAIDEEDEVQESIEVEDNDLFKAHLNGETTTVQEQIQERERCLKNNTEKEVVQKASRYFAKDKSIEPYLKEFTETLFELCPLLDNNQNDIQNIKYKINPLITRDGIRIYIATLKRNNAYTTMRRSPDHKINKLIRILEFAEKEFIFSNLYGLPGSALNKDMSQEWQQFLKKEGVKDFRSWQLVAPRTWRRQDKWINSLNLPTNQEIKACLDKDKDCLDKDSNAFVDPSSVPDLTRKKSVSESLESEYKSFVSDYKSIDENIELPDTKSFPANLDKLVKYVEQNAEQAQFHMHLVTKQAYMANKMETLKACGPNVHQTQILLNDQWTKLMKEYDEIADMNKNWTGSDKSTRYQSPVDRQNARNSQLPNFTTKNNQENILNMGAQLSVLRGKLNVEIDTSLTGGYWGGYGEYHLFHSNDKITQQDINFFQFTFNVEAIVPKNGQFIAKYHFLLDLAKLCWMEKANELQTEIEACTDAIMKEVKE